MKRMQLPLRLSYRALGLLVVLILCFAHETNQTLQAWYTFDNNPNFAADALISVAQGNCPPRTDIQAAKANGNAVATYPVLAPGWIGQGIQFTPATDGTQRVEMGTWNIGPVNNAFTLAAWFKPSSCPGGTTRIVTKASSENSDASFWMLGVTNYGGTKCKLRYRVVFNNDQNQRVERTPNAFSPLVFGTWYHFVATWDGGTLKGYVNGTEIDSSSQTGKIFSEPNGVANIIGNVAPSWNRAFSGVIDEVRIYDHALSAQEVSDLSRLTSVIPGPSLSVPAVVQAQATLPTPLIANATVSNGQQPTFQWNLVSGPCPAVSFENDTSSLLVATFTRITDFTLRVSVNDGQLCALSDVVVQVTGLAPSISLANVNPDTTVFNGLSTTIDPQISGYPDPVIQWQTPGIITTPNITVNSTYTIPSTTGPGWVDIPGATSATYFTPLGTPAIDGMILRVTASNFLDSVTSINITLRYNPNSPDGDGGGENVAGIVAGTVVGAFALCCLIICLVLVIVTWILLKRRQQSYGRRKLVKPDFDPLIFEDMLNNPPIKKDAELKELKHLLVDENMILAEALIASLKPAEKAKIPHAMVFLFESYRNSGQRLLEHFIQTELENSDTEGTLFRANSFSVRLFQPYAKLMGMDYLWTTLAQLLNDLNDLNAENEAAESSDTGNSMSLFNMAVEIDPHKMDEASNPEINTLQLWLIVQKLFVNITRNHSKVPAEIRKVLRYVKEEVAVKFPDAEYSSMGGFFFLRCISPCLIAPHIYGLLENPPHANTQRQLILITKVLQNLANGTLPGEKEEYMQKMNGFITENQKPLHEFFDQITDEARPGDPAGVTIPDNVEVNALIMIHNAILQYRKEIDAKLQDARGGEEVMAKLDEVLRSNPIK